MIGTVVAGRYRCFIVKIGEVHLPQQLVCICSKHSFPEVFQFRVLYFDRTVFVDCFMNRLVRRLKFI
jgi:hypothetical protein